MHQDRGCDERITVRPWGGDMKSGATLRDRGIDRQNAITKCREHMRVEPRVQDRALWRVSTLDQKHPLFKFQTVMTDKKRLVAETLSAHARTL